MTEPTVAEIIRRWEQSPFRRFTVADEAALIASHKALAEGLEIIAGKRQCLDNLMSDRDVARAALKAAGVK